nr:MAG TPA: hypothetical protein [Caudoviricetes sp.]
MNISAFPNESCPKIFPRDYHILIELRLPR